MNRKIILVAVALLFMGAGVVAAIMFPGRHQASGGGNDTYITVAIGLVSLATILASMRARKADEEKKNG